MCSNFEPIKTTQSKWVKDNLDCELPSESWSQHVYSTASVPFVYLENGEPVCKLAQFGLVPAWSKHPKTHGRFTYNARTETVATKDSFKASWKHRKFGLVLTDKFYEPMYNRSGTNSEPTPIFRTDGEPTAIASLWESFVDINTGEVIRSFSMLTINADEHPFMSQFHQHNEEKRSVVVIENGKLMRWLQATHDEAKDMLKPCPDHYLNATYSTNLDAQISMFD